MKPYRKLAALLLAAACSSDVITPDGAGPWGLEPANRAPEAVGEIPAQRLPGPGQAVAVAVGAHFTDPDGDTLTFTASSSDTAVVAAAVDGDTLRLTGGGTGGAGAVAVTATDPSGLSASLAFEVTANRAPVLSGEIPALSMWAFSPTPGWAVPRELLRLNTADLDLSEYFTDPDGDTLTFAASSSDTAVVAVGFWPAGLWVVPRGAVGEAAVTVTATDPDSLEARAVFTVEATEHPDRAALVALYEATGGGPGTNWLSDYPLWHWSGVTVNRDGRVIELKLNVRKLTGSIPPELGNLAELKVLDLSRNALTGPIPPELVNLASLETLDLGWNDLPGSIPPELGNFASLRKLDLSYNELTEPIPPELGNLASLEELYLGGYADDGGNNLTGPIPPELGNLASLERLDLSHNRLTGPIPPELGNLASLRGLGLGGNELTGPIPPELANLASLESLYLGGKLEGGGHAGVPKLSPNVLTGRIPPELGNLANLRTLTLWRSAVTGPIPPELGNLASLETLDLANNELTGPIPPELANLANLRRLGLAGNRDLCAPADPQFRAWLLDRRAIVSPCRSNPDARLLPLALMRADGNGMTLELPQDLNGSAVSVSDPGVVAATLAEFWLELVPLGIGRADVELVPSGGGSPAVATVAVREAVGTFGIDIVMEQPAPLGFEETMVEAADWWSSALNGTEWEDRTAHCSGYATATADELLIGAAHRAGPLSGGAIATARPCFRAVYVGDSRTLEPMGGLVTAGPLAVHDRDIMRHEIGHILGLVGLTGLVTRDFATDRDWGHFIGPRAVEAYRAGGGDPDLPGVPLPVGKGAHWCAPGEIMSTCAGSWNRVSDGLSVAALADLGFTVDMTKATPWRRVGGAAAAAMGGEPFREVVEVRIVPGPVPEPRR